MARFDKGVKQKAQEAATRRTEEEASFVFKSKAFKALIR